MPEASINVNCPQCGKTYAIRFGNDDAVTLTCDQCGKRFRTRRVVGSSSVAASAPTKNGTVIMRVPEAVADATGTAEARRSASAMPTPTAAARRTQSQSGTRQGASSSGVIPADLDEVRKLWESAVGQASNENMSLKPATRAPGARGVPLSAGFGGDDTDEPPLVLDGDAAPAARPRLVSTPEKHVSGADFFVDKILGKGGMGTVYSARQATLNRRVALKAIQPQRANDPDSRAKFLAEAQVTGMLDHPNIVPIYDIGLTDDGLFYTMKEVKGQPWSQRLAALTETENLDIFMKLCDAVAFAHDKGIVHRDIKPENVMLGDYGEVLLMDWGLAARFIRTSGVERLDDVNPRCGTPAYMAPEMAMGKAGLIGTRSDVYLLGATLFELLSRKRPHHGDSVYGCIYAAVTNAIQDVPRADELMAVARKAMATNPADRHPSAKALQQAVRECRNFEVSIALAAEARKTLDEARKTGSYSDHARAVFGFDEALRMWPANAAAKSGLDEAKSAYAGKAIARGDFALAFSQIAGLPPEDADRIAGAVHRGQAVRDRRRRMLYAGGLAIAALFVISVVVVLFAYRNAAVEARKTRSAIARAELAEQNTANAVAELDKIKAAHAASDPAPAVAAVTPDAPDLPGAPADPQASEPVPVRAAAAALALAGPELPLRLATLSRLANDTAATAEQSDNAILAAQLRRFGASFARQHADAPPPSAPDASAAPTAATVAMAAPAAPIRPPLDPALPNVPVVFTPEQEWDFEAGVAEIVAGTKEAAFAGDKALAETASLNKPSAIAVDAEGNLFIADTGNRRLRRIDGKTSLIDTVLTARGVGSDVLRVLSYTVTAMACGPDNRLYLATPGGQITVFDGAANALSVLLEADATSAESGRPFTGRAAANQSVPSALAVAPDGTLYFTTRNGVLNRLRPNDRQVDRLHTRLAPAQQHGLAVLPDGSVAVTDQDGWLTCSPNGAWKRQVAYLEDGTLLPRATMLSATPEGELVMVADGKAYVAWAHDLKTVAPDDPAGETPDSPETALLTVPVFPAMPAAYRIGAGAVLSPSGNALYSIDDHQIQRLRFPSFSEQRAMEVQTRHAADARARFRLHEALRAANPRYRPERAVIGLLGDAATSVRFLPGAGVADLAPLAGLKLREYVHTGEAAPIDLTPLMDMPIATLNLSGCTGLRELGALRGLPELQSVDLSDTGLDRIDFLPSRPFRYLNFANNDLGEAAPLLNRAIEALSIHRNRITDIASLKAASALERIDFQGVGGSGEAWKEVAKATDMDWIVLQRSQRDNIQYHVRTPAP